MDILQECLGYIKNPHSRSVLEIGTGNGIKTKFIYKYFKNYYAIEPNKEMFSVAKKTLKDTGVKLLNMRYNDFIEQNKYKISIYIFINSFHLIDHFKPNKYVKYLVILQPGGRFMDNRLNKDSPEFDEQIYNAFKHKLDKSEK